METGCLLDTEILGEDQAASTSDEVSGILLDASEEVSGSSSCIPTTMDFEFTNTDLEATSDFSIDNSSMFDISESVIDEKGDCGYLFKDSNIFEDVHVKQSGEVDTLSSVSCINKKASSCNDLGLRLQIIPLNNLQFVSTVQTSEGLHILAIPSGSSLNVLPQMSSLIANSQTNDLTSTPSSSHITSIGAQGPTQTVSDTTSDLVQKNSHISTLIVPRSIGDLTKSEDKKLNTNTSRDEHNKVISAYEIHRHLEPCCTQPTTSNTTQSVNVLVAQDILPSKSECVKNGPVIVKSNHANKIHSQVVKPKINVPKTAKTSTSVMKQAIKQKKVFKESKIVIDLRKFAQTKKKQMVSLLNNPKTKRLLYQHSQKLKGDKDKGLKTVKTQQLHHTDMKKSSGSVNPPKTSVSFSKDCETNISKDTDEMKSHKTLTTKKDESQVQIDNNTCKDKIINNKSSSKLDKDKTKSNVSRHKLCSSLPYTKIKRIFKCRTCFAKFNREGNYKNHLLVHKNSDSKEPLISILNENGYQSKEAESCDSGTLKESRHNTDQSSHNTDESSHNTKESSHITEKSSHITDESSSSTVVTRLNTDEASHNSDEASHAEESTEKTACAMDTAISFKCELCPMVFTTEGNLTRHKLTHSQLTKSEARFTCETCKRCFLQGCDLRRHQLTHSGQFPFKCTVCHKGFIRRSDLTVHERFHLKEKNYKCEVCSKSYYQSADLHRHIRTSHSSQCDYTCTQCDRKYSTQKSLNQHLNKHLRQRN